MGFLGAYQSYSSGNIEAGDFESAMAAVGLLGSAPGVARASVFGARGLTSALENYYGGPKAFVNVRRVPAELANEGFPTETAPYAGDAIEFQTGRTMYFVRIRHTGNAGDPAGRFLVSAESVLSKTRSQLKEMLALEGEVIGLQLVKVPPGIRMRAGRVAAQPEWGASSPGDALQYQLLEHISSDSFSEQLIPISP
jgi:hypothetical protein